MPLSDKAKALDQTARVVNALAKIVDFKFRKDRLFHHLSNALGDHVVDKVITDLEHAVETKLPKRVPEKRKR